MGTTSLQLTSDIVGTRCVPLEIEITSPSGTTVPLFENNEDVEDGITDDNISTVFSDSGVPFIVDNMAPSPMPCGAAAGGVPDEWGFNCGLSVQTRILGFCHPFQPLLANFATEDSAGDWMLTVTNIFANNPPITGTLNRWCHIWPYKDIAERETVRKEAAGSPHWPSGAPGRIRQENKIMIPAPFSPMR